MGTTGLRLHYLSLERADRFAIVARGDRRDGRLEGTGFLDALGLHVFEKLRPGFGLLDQLDNFLGLGFAHRPAIAVVVIPDNYDIEDVAGDVTTQERVGASDRLHARLVTRNVG